MDMLFSACAALIITFFFFAFGIRQIKLSRPANKNKKTKLHPANFSANNLHETGILFIFLGILGTLFVILFVCQSDILSLSDELSKPITHITSVIASALPLAALFIFGVYNLARRRIFGLKTTPKSRPIIAKYYKPAAIGAIIASISISCTILMPFIPNIPDFIRYALIGIAAISALTMMVSLSIAELSIEHKNRK